MCARRREWHEPAVLSARVSEFRDAELASLRLFDVPAASIDVATSSMHVVAALDAAVAESRVDLGECADASANAAQAARLLAAFVEHARVAQNTVTQHRTLCPRVSR